MSDVGLRARKKERTRQDLLAVALRLFVEHGFDATTVEQIAAVAGVSPRTFFRYYPTKEDVLFGEHDDEVDRRGEALMAALRDRSDGRSDAQALREVLVALVSGYEDERETLLLRKQVIAATPALRARARQRRERWEDGVVEALLRHRPDGRQPDVALHARVTVAVTAAALHAAIEVWLDTKGRGDLAALVRQAFDHLAAGLDDSVRPDQLPAAPRSTKAKP